ncbi:MAG: chemotaxis protein CheW [Nitrospirota bacterium]
MTEAAAVKRVEEQMEGGRQYVTFCLNEELYAIEALVVQEIIELGAITKVPHLPDFFKGVINLRGTIIPVVDLKMKFAMHSGEYKKHTCVIVTEFSGGTIGLIVDAVSDVLSLANEDISDTPSFGAHITTDFMKGMSRMDGNLAIILDIEKVLSEADTASLSAIRNMDNIKAAEPAR